MPDRDRPIVVGVDDSPDSRAAVEFAVQLADRRGSDLLAVHVWTEHPTDVLRRPGRREAEPAREAAERMLGECLAGYAERHPDLPVRRDVVRASSCPVAVVGPGASQDSADSVPVRHDSRSAAPSNAN
ncbi:universal stress protein [Pseudonocardia sp. H11422]|uniref:universal stress protein n=1 Tax=Pseudonocardia sp. H11422 TaxID=2835866 RepID=UPI001BDDC1A0|nr:universal stress protein [Pseudonocardia sp. H11422]